MRAPAASCSNTPLLYQHAFKYTLSHTNTYTHTHTPVVVSVPMITVTHNGVTQGAEVAAKLVGEGASAEDEEG